MVTEYQKYGIQGSAKSVCYGIDMKLDKKNIWLIVFDG